MAEDEKVVAQYGAAAQFWGKYRHFIRLMYQPVTDALVEDAAVKRGHAVLDVATGPGEPALSIIDLVGPAGQIMGVDPSPAMVELARQEAQRMCLANARFELASADTLPFGNETFDSAICRFGAMFFPSPLDSGREILRVLKPGAKMAFAVWSRRERNPFQYVLYDVVAKHISTPFEEDGLTPFRLAEPGELLAALDKAGACGSHERLLSFQIRVPLSPEDFWEMRSQMSVTLRKRLAKLEPAQVNTIKREVLQAVHPYSSIEGITLPAEILIVSGNKR